MKKSKNVSLLLIGTLAAVPLLSACGPSTENVAVKQNTYASMEDCKKEWANDDKNCKPNGGGAFVGPRYYWNHAGGYPVAVEPNGTTRAISGSSVGKPGVVSVARSVSSSSISVARGGFGGSAHGFSSGG